MNDTQLAAQMVNAANGQLQRFREQRSTVEEGVRAAYLSGVSQLADMLLKLDGDLTVPQVVRAVEAAGRQLGFTYGPPR